MNPIPKWIVAAGAILVIASFLLPAVSFVIFDKETVSLSQVAGFGAIYLYLIPLGGLVAMAMALIPAHNRGLAIGLLGGQIAGLGISLLALCWMVIYILTKQAQQVFDIFGGLIPLTDLAAGIDLTPAIGFIVLLLGYGLAAVGMVWEIFSVVTGSFQRKEAATLESLPAQPIPVSPPPIPVPAPPPPLETLSGGPRLEIVRGHLANQTIPLESENFTIGRGVDSRLRLADPKVSRQHVRLRYAQGAWFIQDQNSTGGTFVNGKRVQATRLNPGDEITIGENTFIFQM